jgi:dTDP-4-dehydrorhamnose 3,5-epimerase
VERAVRDADPGSADLLMIFRELRLKGAFIIEPERLTDERGFFARIWCNREFQAHGLNSHLAQANISYNRVKGTLRGMHYQAHPHEEVKLVRCTMGAVYDVIVDLRGESSTFLQWEAVELHARNRLMLYIPEGFAHGFMTLADEAEVEYYMSESYAPDCARGVRWNDTSIAIRWPLEPRVISPRDLDYPDFRPLGTSQ